MLDPRGQLLRAALGFAALPLPSYDRSLRALRTWLDSWAGIGRVAVGMAHQGYDLQLTPLAIVDPEAALAARRRRGGRSN